MKVEVGMNLEDSCHVYIKVFYHLNSAVGMGAKNFMLFQLWSKLLTYFISSTVTSEPQFFSFSKENTECYLSALL